MGPGFPNYMLVQTPLLAGKAPSSTVPATVTLLTGKHWEMCLASEQNRDIFNPKPK